MFPQYLEKENKREKHREKKTIKRHIQHRRKKKKRNKSFFINRKKKKKTFFLENFLTLTITRNRYTLFSVNVHSNSDPIYKGDHDKQFYKIYNLKLILKRMVNQLIKSLTCLSCLNRVECSHEQMTNSLRNMVDNKLERGPI